MIEPRVAWWRREPVYAVTLDDAAHERVYHAALAVNERRVNGDGAYGTPTNRDKLTTDVLAWGAAYAAGLLCATMTGLPWVWFGEDEEPDEMTGDFTCGGVGIDAKGSADWNDPPNSHLLIGGKHPSSIPCVRIFSPSEREHIVQGWAWKPRGAAPSGRVVPDANDFEYEGQVVYDNNRFVGPVVFDPTGPNVAIPVQATHPMDDLFTTITSRTGTAVV